MHGLAYEPWVLIEGARTYGFSARVSETLEGTPMHKFAAATALVIALITMLTLTVSASLTPANAQGRFCGCYGSPALSFSKCCGAASQELSVTSMSYHQTFAHV
jgi:hypothetical protein